MQQKQSTKDVDYDQILEGGHHVWAQGSVVEGTSKWGKIDTNSLPRESKAP